MFLIFWVLFFVLFVTRFCIVSTVRKLVVGYFVSHHLLVPRLNTEKSRFIVRILHQKLFGATKSHCKCVVFEYDDFLQVQKIRLEE